MDIGLKLVDEIFEFVDGDNGWSVRSERGFERWPGELSQTIWADYPVLEEGFEIARVSVETDVALDIRVDEQTYAKIATLNSIVSLSSWVCRPEEASVSLNCSFYVHAESLAWLKPLVAVATQLQAADAHAVAEDVAQLLRGRVATSAHPSAGPRADVDKTIEIFGAYVQSKGLKHRHSRLTSSRPARRCAAGSDSWPRPATTE